MIAVTTTPPNISIFRKFNVWYTIKDGNWSDPGIWMSNGTKKHSLPQAGDDVYVCHIVVIDVNVNIKNLYVSGTLKGTSLTAVNINVNGDCQVSGSGLIDLSLQFNNLILNGYNNVIANSAFVCGLYSTVTYNGAFNQPILNLNYRNLSTQNTGLKYQTSDITLLGNFNQQSNYECGAFNFTVTGTSTIGTVGYYTFSKNSPVGSILFIGNVDFEGSTNLGGNPNVEFRGGMQIHTFGLTTGTGVFKFTTNNQTINCSAYLGGTWNASVVIQGAITVTISGNSALQINNTINGTSSSSTLNNSGILYLGINSVPMSMGIFNYQYTASSTLGYAFSGNFILPYNSYAGLYINGTGVKTLSGNTVLTYNFISDGNFETNGYNLTINGTTTNTGLGVFTVSSFANLLFVGAVSWMSNGTYGVDFSSGNPNAEFRGGLTVHTNLFNTGTGTLKFSTNNQTLSFSAYNGGTCAASFLISGPITLNFLSGLFLISSSGNINGDNSSSTFNNQGTFLYGNVQQPMQTGILINSLPVSIFNYNSSGNQDVTPGIYKNLTLSNGGSKRLLGNVSVTTTYSLVSPATLNLNGFSLTNP